MKIIKLLLKQVKNTLFLSIVTTLFSCPLQADFFAFRKLTHPDTKKTVFVLYDTHCTIESEEAKEKSDKIQETIEQCKIPVQDSDIDLLKKQISDCRNTLPNLTKQHNDLKEYLQKYNVSVIVEDSCRIPIVKIVERAQSKVDKIHQMLAYDHFLPQYIGRQFRHGTKTYSGPLSPMAGLGEALVGKHTVDEFVKFGKKAYFYNPDVRVDGYHKDGHQVVDTNTLKAIETLFTTYNQSSVVVAEGANHSVHIVRDLVKKGYIAGDLIISEALAQKRKESAVLNSYIQHLIDHDAEQAVSVSHRESAEDQYNRIAEPLDIAAIFQKEFANVKIDTFDDGISEELPKDQSSSSEQPTSLSKDKESIKVMKNNKDNKLTIIERPTDYLALTTKKSIFNGWVLGGVLGLGSFWITKKAGLSNRWAALTGLTAWAATKAFFWYQHNYGIISQAKFFFGLQNAKTGEEASKLFDRLSSVDQQDAAVLASYQNSLGRFFTQLKNVSDEISTSQYRFNQKMNGFKNTQQKAAYLKSQEYIDFMQKLTASQKKNQ